MRVKRLNPYLRPKRRGATKSGAALSIWRANENLDVEPERVEANRDEFNKEVTAQNLPVTFFDGLNSERVELFNSPNSRSDTSSSASLDRQASAPISINIFKTNRIK